MRKIQLFFLIMVFMLSCMEKPTAIDASKITGIETETETETETAEIRWEFHTGDRVCSSPAIDTDGTVYVGSKDGMLYALNPNGTQKWQFQTDGTPSSPVIGTDGAVYVAAGSLYAINPDGTPRWQFQPRVSSWEFLSSSPAIAADGTVYIVANGLSVYAINPDGVLKWEFKVLSNNGSGSILPSSPAIATDGTVYIVGMDGPSDYRTGTLYAISPNGTEKWEFRIGQGDFLSSPAIAADGTVYVGSDDGNFFALNPDGTEKWRFQTDGPVLSSPAIAADGTVYVGSDDNKLYAIYSENGGLANSPWPKFQGNNQNTGVVPK